MIGGAGDGYLNSFASSLSGSRVVRR